jgi:hypothetical protein
VELHFLTSSLLHLVFLLVVTLRGPSGPTGATAWSFKGAAADSGDIIAMQFITTDQMNMASSPPHGFETQLKNPKPSPRLTAPNRKDKNTIRPREGRSGSNYRVANRVPLRASPELPRLHIALGSNLTIKTILI